MEEILELIRKETGDPKAYFPSMLDLNNGKSRYVWNAQFRKKNHKGEWMKKTFEMPCAIKYCPFTGKELDPETPDSK